jgi:Na+/melibiose symporter-like transporter
MTSFKRSAFLFLTTASILADAVIAWYAFAGLAEASGVPPMFLAAGLVNAIAFLCYLRLVQKSEHLTTEQKNMWTIGLFFGLGVAQAIYFARYVNREGPQ